MLLLRHSVENKSVLQVSYFITSNKYEVEAGVLFILEIHSASELDLINISGSAESSVCVFGYKGLSC